MVLLSNNTGSLISITVDLVIDSQGTLYNNDGSSGSSVTISLPNGNSKYIDISALVEGIIEYTISVVGGINLTATRSVESVGGNANTFVRVFNVQGFVVNAGSQNNWTLDSTQAEDRDGDDDLDRVEFTVRDSDGTSVATLTECPGSGAQYDGANLTFAPDDPGYDVLAGETYALTVQAFDIDGHSDSETVEDTAPTNDPTAIQINNFQGFDVDVQGNHWSIQQVQAQDQTQPYNLDRAEYEITDSNDTARATRTDTGIDPQQYQPPQNQEFEPDDPGYTVGSGETYTITLTVYDEDGNFATASLQATG
jgi:hypothetical protein